MLNSSEKEDIYNKLSSSFKLDTLIPMATIALYLKNNGIDYLSKGYKKLKTLLKDLDFIKINQKNDEDKHVEYVLIKSREKQQVDKDKLLSELKKEFKLNTVYPIAKVSLYLNDIGIDYHKYGYSKMKDFLSTLDFIKVKTLGKNTSITIVENSKKTEKKKDDVGTIFVPTNLVSLFNEIYSSNLDQKQVTKIINLSYKKAKEKNELFTTNDSTGFVLDYKKVSEVIIAAIKKSTSQTHYSYFVNYIGSQGDKTKPDLKNKIQFSDYEKSLEQLSSLAKKEAWCYKASKDKHVILKIYLLYTFLHLENNKKIMYSSDNRYACFNTGLITNLLEEIYCLLEVKGQQFIFKDFCVAGEKASGKIVVENFSPLPEKAKYITNTSDIYFDSDAQVLIDYKHIILDNIARIPLTFLSKFSKAFPKANDILKNIEKAKKKPYSDDLVNRLYSKYTLILKDNNELFNFIKASLEHAISNSIKCAKNNYRFVLPSFFPTRNVMSLMLPVSLEKGSIAQFVLLLEKTPSGNYQGQTILTLKQCYANARLLSSLEYTFLNPSEIND